MEWNKVFYYSPQDGLLRWKEQDACSFARPRDAKRFNLMYSNNVAGNPNSSGYLKLSYRGACYYVHRIVWEMLNGPIPDGMVIDHANKDKSDNRISNLRLATVTQNVANSKARSHNKSGIKGVRFVSGKARPWRARIGHLGKDLHLGYYESKEDARSAYRRAASLLYGEFAAPI